MSKPLFNSEDEAVKVIRRCFDSIQIIESPYQCSDDIASPPVVRAVGRSLMQHVHTFCEALLYLVCRERLEHREDISQEEWPKIHEMRKHCKQYNYIDCPPVVYDAADRMAKLKKSCDKKAEVTPHDLAQFFGEAEVLVNWLKNVLKSSAERKGAVDVDHHEEKKGGLLSFINDWLEHYRRESARNTDDYHWSFRYKDVNTDNMTDEEEDDFYRQRKGNKRESMAPLFIYLILQRFDKDNRAHVSDIQDILKEEYEIELSRGAVERALNTMVDGGDVNIWSGLKRGSGYWYSEEDENEEIE